MPASRQRPTSLFPSSTPVEPHALKNSVPPPNVPRPKHRDDTFRPEPPNSMYSICSPRKVGNGNCDVSNLIRELLFNIVSQDFQILAGSGAWPTAAMRFAPDAKNLAKKWVARCAYFAFPPQHFLHCGITADAVSVVCFLAGQQAFGQITTSVSRTDQGGQCLPSSKPQEMQRRDQSLVCVQCGVSPSNFVIR